MINEKEIFQIVLSVASIRKYLYSEQLHNTLNSIGDIHLKSAGQALEAAKKSSNPNIQITEAFYNLRIAHNAYKDSWKKKNTFLKKAATNLQTIETIEKHIFSCLLRAICAKLLGLKNEINLSIDNAIEAKKFEKEVVRVGETSGNYADFFWAFNFSEQKRFWGFHDKPVLYIGFTWVEDFEKFREILLS